MAVYSALSWLLCLTTSLVLGLSIWRDRSLLIRPSVFVVLSFHLMIQWAAAADAERIYAYLPDPWTFVLLAHGFPLMGLVVSLTQARNGQHTVWRRMLHRPQRSTRHQNGATLILAACVAAVAAYYFATVPISRTGMYAILFEPERSSIAREESMKLINNSLLKYSFSFMTATFAPLLAVLLAERLARSLRTLRVLQALVAALAIVGVLAAVSPTGARGYPADIIFVMLLAWLLRKGVPLNLFYAVPAVLATLAFPTVLTIMREGRAIDLQTLWDTLQTAMVTRVFSVPMETGLWHAHYAQTVGLVGIRAIPKLAALVGDSPVNVANVIGLIYGLNPLESVSANTCYVFSYYCYFGLLSLPVSLLGLWLLDGALWIYQRMSDALLLACVATVCKASLALASSDYTTVLLSHGLGLVPVVALAIDRLCAGRVRCRYPGAPDIAPSSIR